MKRIPDERTYKDPVCGMEISRVAAVEEYSFEGKHYYFCSGACRAAFVAEPDKYQRRHRQRGVLQH